MAVLPARRLARSRVDLRSPDTAANILRNLTNTIIDIILAPVPSVLRDIVKTILSPIFDAIAAILDIPNDILQWLSSQLQISFGLFNLLGSGS